MILLQFTTRDFEYDIYSLVRSFYPGEDVPICGPEDEPAKDWRLKILLDYRTDGFSIGLFLADGTLQAEADEQIDFYADRSAAKNRLKYRLYQMLSAFTGQTLPWGTLTGIRPTKIPMKLLEEGQRPAQIAKYMRETYLISPQKTALGISIAVREKDLLDRTSYSDGYSLYIGIPFCPSICLYCSFSSSPLAVWEKRVDDYLDALCKEISYGAEAFRDRPLNTIYIGGGTPTTLNPAQLDRLLTEVESRFDIGRVQEYTVEAGRPDSITREKLEVLKRHPVTRISINPQTMNQRTLDVIGRRHTTEQTEEAFRLARSLGFDNINMDLIVGLPGEEKPEVEQTLAKVRELNPDSLTIHSLAIKRAARLNIFKDQYKEMTFVNSCEIMDMAGACAQKMEMFPYYLYRQKNMAGNFENVGYARAGKEGLYNILIMEEKQSILALGAGASTKRVWEKPNADGSCRIERCENVKNIEQYIERVDEMIERKRELFGKE